MADKNVKFVLDLDIKEFTEKLLSAKGELKSLGDKDNLSELVEGLTQTTAILGTVGLAVFAFKKALDFTIEAEQIQKVQKQFEALADIAGIPSKELKEGLEKSAQGLITTGELLETANKAIVGMGSSAKKLPEVMELARKATSVFGGDLKTNFDNLTTAITNGNARMLKQYGIVIDTEKAVREFAKAHNLAANEVSEAGRRQAILNAALEQGQKNFKGIQGNIDSAQSTLTLLKNTLSETAEVAILAFEKKMGPTVRSLLKGVKEFAEGARQSLTAEFGEGLEKSTAQIGQTEKKLQELKGQLVDLQYGFEGNGFFEKLFKGNKEDRITKLNQDIAETTQKLEQLRVENSKLEEQEKSKVSSIGGASGGARDSEDIARKEVQKANEAKFQAEMLALKKKYFDEEQLNIQSLDQLDAFTKEAKFFREAEHQQKLNEIRTNENLNHTQKLQLMAMEEKRYQASVRQQEQETAATRLKLLDQYQKNSNNAFQGIGRAFQVMAMKNKAAMSDFGKRGEEVVGSFQRHSTYAFEKMGEDMVKGKSIAEAAADAMKGFFLNMLADRAIGEGQIMLLSGIWPPNPAAIAAGAGLIALGGALRTLGGGSGATIGGATGGGAGVSNGYGVATEGKSAVEAAGVKSPEEQAPPEMQQMERHQRAVNVQIAGNYFDTDTSRRQLMEMIRQETDATDFRYDRIGAG